MPEKNFGRRKFLRSTAAVGLAGLGGIAATGTAAANSTLWVESNSNYWEYELYTSTNGIGLEHGAYAEPNQDIIQGGASGDEGVRGEVSKGGYDNFHMDAQDDSLSFFQADYNDFPGYIQILSDTTNYTQILEIKRDESPYNPDYNYAVEVSGDVEYANFGDPGQDEIDGNRVEGTIEADDEDTFYITGDIIRIEIQDPSDGGQVNNGLVVDIPN